MVLQEIIPDQLLPLLTSCHLSLLANSIKSICLWLALPFLILQLHPVLWSCWVPSLPILFYLYAMTLISAPALYVVSILVCIGTRPLLPPLPLSQSTPLQNKVPSIYVSIVFIISGYCIIFKLSLNTSSSSLCTMRTLRAEALSYSSLYPWYNVEPIVKG